MRGGLHRPDRVGWAGVRFQNLVDVTGELPGADLPGITQRERAAGLPRNFQCAHACDTKIVVETPTGWSPITSSGPVTG